MPHSRSVWLMCAVGLFASLVQGYDMYRLVGDRLSFVDWTIILLLLASPPFALWRHLRRVTDLTDDILATGSRIAVGGYLPLWFGFSLVRKIALG
jgi:hypothetical protein